MTEIEKEMLAIRALVTEAWGRALAVNTKELNLNSLLLHLDEANASIDEAIRSYVNARPA